jgi:hypothetical protein
MGYAAGRRLVVVAVASLGLAAGGRLLAQDRSGGVRAHVVRIEGDDVFLDVGSGEASRGSELTVYRTIEVRHPVTRARLRDRFPIGRVRIVSPGETLSIARVVATPHWPVEVGDAVESELAARASLSPARVSTAAAVAECPQAPCPECECAAPEGDAEAQEIVAVWRATLGKTPEERERLYGIFIQRNPNSPYVPQVQGEIRTLRELREQERGLRARAIFAATRSIAAREDVRGAVATTRLDRAQASDPVEIAATVAPDAGIRSLVLYVRRDGSETFRVIAMEADGRGHARARVPDELVREPGFQYFIEASRDGEEPTAVFASGAAPHPVEVVSAEPDLAPRGRSRVRLSSEVVSFNGLEGNDWYVITEGDFLYRTLFSVLYAVRVGYGNVTGEGGTVEELDDLGLPPEKVGFTYGFLESELRVSELFGLMMRTTVGLGRPEHANDDGLRGGFQLRIRIGEERGTNLVLAGETIPELGQRAFIGLTWVAIERWPMTAEVHVTDQPVNSDELAVRGVFEVGFEATDDVALAARLSYQGRTIDHAGFGAGLAATFDW